MPSPLSVGDIADALTERSFPAITTWNRLESRPRSQNFDRALHAEIRDALWMLTKQWQMGEFRGSDAGSPVFAKAALVHDAPHQVPRCRWRSPTLRCVNPARDQGRTPRLCHCTASCDLSPGLASGHGAPVVRPHCRFRADYRAAFTNGLPDRNARSHATARTSMSALIPRPGTPFRHWPDAPWTAARCSNICWPILRTSRLRRRRRHQSGDHTALSTIARSGSSHGPPDFSPARILNRTMHGCPNHLDYQFAASAPLPDGKRESVRRRRLLIRPNSTGTASISTQASQRSAALPGSETTGLPPDAPFTTIPIPVSFSGMPNTRWWTFEDHATNFGDIDASTTDLAKLLFMEFALVYSNDWFVIPCTLPSGSLARVRGMAVTNVFGERLWIQAADQGTEKRGDAGACSPSTFATPPAGSTSADTTLLLLPTLASALYGPLAGRSFPCT